MGGRDLSIMAAGDLTASTPVLATTPTEVKAAIDALNLTATTDRLVVIPKTHGQFYIFKVERAA